MTLNDLQLKIMDYSIIFENDALTVCVLRKDVLLTLGLPIKLHPVPDQFATHLLILIKLHRFVAHTVLGIKT